MFTTRRCLNTTEMWRSSPSPSITRTGCSSCPTACVWRWRGTTSRAGCCGPVAPPEWIITIMLRARRCTIRELGIGSAVGPHCRRPAMGRGHRGTRPRAMPADTEARVCDFADLVATAIDNAQAHADSSRQAPASSRQLTMPAAYRTRSARWCATAPGLARPRTAHVEADVPAHLPPLKKRISDLVATVAGVSTDLQELSRGIHPAILSRGGLGPALKTLARRCTVPVTLELDIERRLPTQSKSVPTTSPPRRNQCRRSMPAPLR